jgi:hypothetical protein
LRSYWKQFKVEILNIKGEKDVLRWDECDFDSFRSLRLNVKKFL